MTSIYHFLSSPCASKPRTVLDPSNHSLSKHVVVDQPDVIPKPTTNSKISLRTAEKNECCPPVPLPEEEIKQRLSRNFNFKTLEFPPTPPALSNTDTANPSVSLMKSSDAVDLSESPTTTENVVLSEAKPPTVHEETQYLNLIREIIDTGSYETSRNGNTYTKFGYNMRFSLKDGRIPLITTKKMVVKACFEELFWFIRGSTSSTELQERGVNIWNRNGTREFLDSRGLYHLDEGDLGPIYGHQWRHFNAEYTNSSTCYKGSGIDQLKYVIDELSDPQTRSSRRIIMTAWNPCQINQMALPPCHIMAQFHVRDNKYLSCALFQRSGDVGLGIPFNIASYALLTHILAKHCGLEAEEFVHFLGNCHIYEEHVDALKKQMVLEPKEFPQIEINKRDEIEDYGIDDIVWMTPYQSHPSIKMDMKA